MPDEKCILDPERDCIGNGVLVGKPAGSGYQSDLAIGIRRIL